MTRGRLYAQYMVQCNDCEHTATLTATKRESALFELNRAGWVSRREVDGCRPATWYCRQCWENMMRKIRESHGSRTVV